MHYQEQSYDFLFIWVRRWRAANMLRKMIYIPGELEKEAKKHVRTFGDLKKFLQTASDSYMDRLLKAKKTHHT